jgi:uncharacterized protein DUF268
MAFLWKLKRATRAIDSLLGTYGFSPLKTVRAIRGTPPFLRDHRKFKQMLGRRTDWPFGPLMPMLEDRDTQSGSAGGHYFHQDLLVAQRIHSANPRRHIDGGSRIDGFVAHVASFREIEIVDIRPLDSHISNVKFMQMDLMDNIGPQHTAICDSLSCLHVLEHFGLGRYGDRVDPDGYTTGFANLVQILETGGTLYFSVPMGRQRLVFNAHRIFGLAHLLDMFQRQNLKLLEFSYVKDDGGLIENVSITPEIMAAVNDLTYGCGIFILKKLA